MSRPANLYRPGHATETVTPANGKAFELAELYTLIECRTIQVVRLRDSGRLMVIDEDGKLSPDPKPYNHHATVIAQFENAIRLDDYIVGVAVVCWPETFK